MIKTPMTNRCLFIRPIGASLRALLLLSVLGIFTALRGASGAVPAALGATLEAVSFDSAPAQILVDEDIWMRRQDVLKGIDDNLSYLRTSRASNEYAPFEAKGISRGAVERSLERFRGVLLISESASELKEALEREFRLYRSVGHDGQGTVKFTGYFQPVYKASRKRTYEYQYPLFSTPSDFSSWKTPHPTRIQLEGYNGKGGRGTLLEGKELAWLRTRYEAFMVQVQGSAVLETEDGQQLAIGYAANTDYRFVGFNKSCMVNNIHGWGYEKFFKRSPEELNRCLAKNNRFIFFKLNSTASPIGNLGVPVIAERSIATDKSKLPPGALGIVRTAIPKKNPKGRLEMQRTSLIVLDQDTGGAIKGPGRVDIFMGTGAEAERKAHSTLSEGQLYYLVLKESSSTS